MYFILDASIALSWCFADESTVKTNELLEKLVTGGAFVPSIWPLEVGNILIAAERRHRISYADIMQFLALLEKLSIEIDQETPFRSFREILALAHAEHLTTYDAAYLELAMRKGMPLATKDKELSVAASKLGVEVLVA